MFQIGKFAVEFDKCSLFGITQHTEWRMVSLFGFMRVVWGTPDYKGQGWIFNLTNLGWIYMELTEYGFNTRSQFNLWTWLFGERLKEVVKPLESRVVRFKGKEYTIALVRCTYVREKLPTWLAYGFENKYHVTAVDGSFDSLRFFPLAWKEQPTPTDDEIINRAFEVKELMNKTIEEISAINQDKLSV